MPVQTAFVPMVSERFVPLCEYREDRTALMFQLTQGVAMLAFDTSGPLVPSVVGPVPCALWHSVDTGNGPGTFRLSKAIDGDLVKQAWYGWTKFPTFNAIPAPWVRHVIAGAPPLATFAITPILPLVVLVVFMVGTGPATATVTSAALGNISALFGNSLPDGGGDFGRVEVFCFAPGISDTVTIAADINCTCIAYVTSVNGELSGLAQGGAQGVGVNQAIGLINITTSTVQSPISLRQPVLVVTNSFGPAATFTYAGNVLPTGSLAAPSTFTEPQVSPDATTWLSEGLISQTTAVGVPASVTITHDVIQTDTISVIITFNLPAPRRMCVVEAFDIVQPPPPKKTFTVSLPRLSPDAIAALHDLMSRVQSSQEDGQ